MGKVAWFLEKDVWKARYARGIEMEVRWLDQVGWCGEVTNASPLGVSVCRTTPGRQLLKTAKRDATQLAREVADRR